MKSLSQTSHENWYNRKGPALQTRSSAIAEGPRDASCQLKSCQLPRNSAETTYTTSPDQINGMNNNNNNNNNDRLTAFDPGQPG